jgi:2-acylglycerol O-acyltransferase 2
MDGILYEALPGRQVLTLAASVLFQLPLVRELALWTRCIDASKPVAMRALKAGNSLMVLPGGTMEQIRTQFGQEEVHLRPSFVKLALEAGTALVPCYVFGCVDLYKTSSALFSLRERIRKSFGACIPLYSGSVGVLPRRVPLDVVFGEPLEFEPCAQPGKATDEEVGVALRAYVEALERLFDEHKGSFGYADRKLRIHVQQDRGR